MAQMPWIVFLLEGAESRVLLAAMGAKTLKRAEACETVTKGVVIPDYPQNAETAMELMQELGVPKDDQSRSRFSTIGEVPPAGAEVIVMVRRGHPFNPKGVQWYIGAAPKKSN